LNIGDIVEEIGEFNAFVKVP